MRASCLALTLAVAGLLAAVPVYSQGQASVTGEIFYLERIALPPAARVTVQLQDVSLADAPATVLAEQVIDPAGAGPPYAFTLPYDPAQIQNNRSYAVRATISDGNRLLFTSTERISVITRGGPTSGVRVRVSAAGSGDAGSGDAGSGSADPAPTTLPATGHTGSPITLLLLLAALAGVGGLLLRRANAQS